MKRYLIIITLLINTSLFVAQPPEKHPKWIMDNMKQINDGNSGLYNFYSDYPMPYYVPTYEDILEKVIRITKFLEKSTSKSVVDGKTGKTITNLKELSPDFNFGETDFRPYNYEWGVTYAGMIRLYQVTGDERFKDYCVPRMRLLYDVLPTVQKFANQNPNYRGTLNTIVLPRELDHAGSICAAMILCSREGIINFSLRPHIDHLMDWIVNKQHRLDNGTFVREVPYKYTIWLDDIYMSVPALVQMYALTKENKYLEDAINQVIRFTEKLFIPKRSLFMHSYVTTMEVHPAYFWGRANGWATLAMSELLNLLPTEHPRYQEVLDIFKKHCWGLINCQASNGMWHQLLDRNDSYLESSATAMFVYGLAKGVNRGWLDEKVFGPPALLGWNGLSTQINNTGQIENVCVGTGVAYDVGYYYFRHVHPYTSHGYGPVLLAGAEILEMIKNKKIILNSSINFSTED
ncbi:MAG: glycoside hydrolase family 88 protein [Paludibacter sp.]|nr:glycoside hydrolase family 88 protein [Paludibacter sp.]